MRLRQQVTNRYGSPGSGMWDHRLYEASVCPRMVKHKQSPLHTRRLKSQDYENLSSTSTTPGLSVSYTPPSRLTSLLLCLGPGVLVSRSHLALLPSLFACVSLPRCALARSATPTRPCYSPLGLQFAVGETSSTGYGRSLSSLHFH